jgi:hypothetical protein
MNQKMKKEYTSPGMKVVELKRQSPLMQASENTSLIKNEIGMAPLDELPRG